MIKLLDVLKIVLKEAAPTVDDYDNSTYGVSDDDSGEEKKSRQLKNYSGDKVDYRNRTDFETGKGKGHEGWFDDEIQFDQELKSIVDRYHKKAAMMRSRGTTTRADVRGGKLGWEVRNYIIKLPTGPSWGEFLTDRKTVINKLRAFVMQFVEYVTGPDYTGKPYQDLDDKELASWLKSFKVDSKTETIYLTIPKHAKKAIEAYLVDRYPNTGQKKGGEVNSVFVGFPHEFEKRKQVNATNVRRRETPAQKRRRIQGGDSEEETV